MFVGTIYASLFAILLIAATRANDPQCTYLTADRVLLASRQQNFRGAECEMRLHYWCFSEDLAALPLFSNDSNKEENSQSAMHCREIHYQKMLAAFLIRFPSNVVFLQTFLRGSRSINLKLFIYRRTHNSTISMGLA